MESSCNTMEPELPITWTKQSPHIWRPVDKIPTTLPIQYVHFSHCIQQSSVTYNSHLVESQWDYQNRVEPYIKQSPSLVITKHTTQPLGHTLHSWPYKTTHTTLSRVVTMNSLPSDVRLGIHPLVNCLLIMCSH